MRAVDTNVLVRLIKTVVRRSARHTSEDIHRVLFPKRRPKLRTAFWTSPDRRLGAADGKIYLSSEDGEMLVVRAGRTFEHLATNSIGELLMATPALSEGVMYVRSAASLFAIGKKR